MGRRLGGRVRRALRRLLWARGEVTSRRVFEWEAQAGAIAKKSGFASLAEYEDVSMNIAMIMYGIDPQTKKFTEPPEQIKKEIAALKGDKSVAESEKREGLAQLEAALKDAKPVQFKENIALVLKYFEQLVPFMQEQPAD